MKIRQEINITCGDQAVAATTDTLARVQLDTTQYSGTVSYYFEAVVSASSSNAANIVKLRTGTTDDASIPNSSMTTSLLRVRTAAFTPTGTTPEYFVRIERGAGTVTVRSAKIIIIQDFTTLTSTETQIEIGNYETGKTNTTDTALTNPKYWLYTAANWDGTKTFYAEVTYGSSSNMQNYTFKLQEDNGSFASWTDKVTIVSAGTGTTPTRFRSASFTPTDGRNYRIVTTSSSNMVTHDIYNAKIVVQQSVGFYFNASDAAASDPNNVWFSDDRVFNGLVGVNQYSNTTTNGSTSSNYLMAEGTNAPTSGESISSVKVRMYAQNGTGAEANAAVYTDGLGELLGTATFTDQTLFLGYGSYTTLDTPSGGWTWQKVNDLEVKLYRTGTGTNNTFVYLVEVFVESNSNVITKLEPQYLLANTGSFGGSTGLKDYDTLYDPAEWDGVV